MNTIVWSYSSLLLYIFISLIAAYGIKNAKTNGIRIIAGGITINVGYVLFFCGFWLLAILRSVENGLGGGDIWNYLRIFEESLKVPLSFDFFSKSSEVEPLFLLLNKCIYAINSNPRFYLAVMYGIIVIGYLMFIRSWCPQKISYIPLIVLIFPFLKSFCTLRSSIAIAIILIGISVFKKNKLLGSIITLLSPFIHISEVLYVPFILFHDLYRKKIKKMNKYRLCIFILMYLLLAYLASIIFKNYFGTMLITGRYSYYAGDLKGSSFIQRIPLYFTQIVLAIALVLIDEKTYISQNSHSEGEKSKIEFIKVCCIYDILVIPVAYMFGIWRAGEFFYLPRLIMWGILIYGLCRNRVKNHSSLFIIKMLAWFVAFGWIIFRITREYLELGIMPYQLLGH